MARSPFGDVAPWVVAAMAHGLGAATWILAGGMLPGGRWLGVHLVTLGVLSNVVLGFSRHFSETLTRIPRPRSDRSMLRVIAFNIAVVAIIVGVAAVLPLVTGIGAMAATMVVGDNYLHLRRCRRRALGARFGWVVRGYERAHGAFVHGAFLGALMGTGFVDSRWYAGTRLAHLHLNVLGWAGGTLLATIVFFGPTMARTRILAGADERTAVGVRVGAHGVAVAAVGLLASGVDGEWGLAARGVAALGLTAFAWAATGICRDVVRAVSTAGPTESRGHVLALCRWLPALAWADVVVVALGWWRALEAIGVGALLGVLVQAVVATLVYVAPMLLAARGAARERIRSGLGRLVRTRTVAFNLATLAIVATAALGSSAGHLGSLVARTGWIVLVGAVLLPVVTIVRGFIGRDL